MPFFRVERHVITKYVPPLSTLRQRLRRQNMQGKRAGFGLVMDDVLSGADIDIYGLADATRRRANGFGRALHADGAILNRMDLATAVRARPDLKACRKIYFCSGTRN